MKHVQCQYTRSTSKENASLWRNERRKGIGADTAARWHTWTSVRSSPTAKIKTKAHAHTRCYIISRRSRRSWERQAGSTNAKISIAIEAPWESRPARALFEFKAFTADAFPKVTVSDVPYAMNHPSPSAPNIAILEASDSCDQCQVSLARVIDGWSGTPRSIFGCCPLEVSFSKACCVVSFSNTLLLVTIRTVWSARKYRRPS